MEYLAEETLDVSLSHRKSYPEYKDSGVEWLEEIPEFWKVVRIKFVSYIKARVGWHGLNSSEFMDEGAYLVTGTDFQNGHVEWDTCYHVSNERYQQDPYIQLCEGDLLITKDGTIGKTAVVKNLPSEATLNSGIFLVRPLNGAYITRFLYWLLNSDVFTQYILFTSMGSTIQHLYQKTFEEFAIVLPSLNEQLAIAAFLDRETAKLDALIAKKRELIVLLQEQRSALISHAVTKGLNPDAPMKDSGIEWLGEIPERWLQTRIKFISTLKGRLGWQNLRADEYTDEGPYVVSSEQFSNHRIQWEKCPHVTFERYLLDSNIQLAPNDVLLMKDGAAMGKLAYVDKLPDLACLNSHLLLFRPKHKRYIPRFMFFLLASKSFQHYIKIYGTGSTFLGISQHSIGDFELFLPSLNEQKAIVEYIESAISNLDDLLTKTEETLIRLQEYRSALISAAVTGKIDVRGEM